jgi:adenylyltransferase/sulfurtransferase
MNEQQAQRYSRQMVLPQIDAAGQQRLLAARVLIIGVGGLGSPAAMYLASAGVGQLVLTDFDRVELSNLHRQILHRTSDIGQPKVLAAQTALRELNPDVDVLPLNGHLQDDSLRAAVAAADVVLDCSDNLATRFDVNDACFNTGTPLVSGAAIRFEGQVSVFIPKRPDSPCYRCLYPASSAPDDGCSRVGIFPPMVGMIGCLQAQEALKLILGIGEPLCGRVAYLDAQSAAWHTVRLHRNPGCVTCGDRHVAATGSN